MRFKKQIVIICLFTFLFIPFSGYKKVNAEPITLTTGMLYLLLSGLATTTGLILINDDMVADVGSRMYDSLKQHIQLKDGSYYIEKSFDVMSKVFDVISSLPKSSSPYSYYYTIHSDGTLWNKFAFRHTGVTGSNASLVGSYNVPTYGDYINIEYKYTDGSYRTRTVSTKSGHFNGDLYFYYYLGNFGSYTLSWSTNPSSLWGADYGEIVTSKNSDFVTEFRITSPGSFTGSNDVTIDYSPSICPDLPNTQDEKEQFINGLTGGGVSIPLDGNPSIDKPIAPGWTNGSIDYPITKPTDIPSVDEEVGTGTVPDIDVPDTGNSALDGLGKWLGKLLTGLFSPITSLLSEILNFLKGLIIPDKFNEFDFSPLYVSFADKFPFCIPFFIIDAVNKFQSGPQEPKFFIDMSSFSSGKNAKGSVGFELDFTEFEKLFGIIRTITLVSFIVSLAFKTRDIIKG